MNVNFSETLRRTWLGMEANPLVHSDDLLKAYNRPSTSSDLSPSKPSSKWFISKNTIISGLGLFGTKQVSTAESTSGDAAPAKTRRKRIIRKKVTAS